MKPIKSVSHGHDLNLKNAIPKRLLEGLIHSETRFRVFDPVTTLYLFLLQAMRGYSCREALAHFNISKNANGEKPVSLNTGAYSRAKSKLCEKQLKSIATLGTKSKGGDIYYVDGTTFQAFDNQKNQRAYPQNPKQKIGLGQPILRSVLIFCARTGKIVEYIVGAYSGKGTAEPSLFKKIIGYFKPGDIIIGDRFYSGFPLCKMMIDKKLGFIVRAKDSFVMKRIGRFRDKSLILGDPRRESKERIQIRMIKYKSTKKGFRDKEFYFLTNLDKEKYSKEDIACLYLRRWDCELSLRSLKQTLGCYLIQAKCPAMIRKIIAIKILAYNLTRKIISSISKDPLKRSFKLSMNILAEIITRREASKANSIVSMIERYKLNSPPRSEIRKLKRRHKGTYGYLMKPRSEYAASNAFA